MKTYPFDTSIKHHLLIAMGMAVWIFVFLYFTEPLDVNELRPSEKLIYLPVYGIIGALCYIMVLPLQYSRFHRNDKQWNYTSEILIMCIFILFSFIVTRAFYLYVIMDNNPNSYSLGYFFLSIYLPAISTILPIVLIGRFAFGKYATKKIEAQKIEIKGDGNYEGIRLLFSDLIMLEASDNYVEVHYQNQGTLTKQLIRTRLSELEQQFPDLLRTQRSFLVNPEHFTSYKTVSGKLGVLLSHDSFAPVSKTFAPRVKEVFNFTTN